MLTKTEVLNSIAKEMKIVSHLATKIQAAQLPYRITPPQRSNQELLEYIAIMAEGGVAMLLSGSWEHFGVRAKAISGTALDRFPAAFAIQLQNVEQLLAPLSDAEFAAKRVKNPQGIELALPEALFEGVVKQLVGYKMQLFLQVKAAGNPQLATPNLWRGEDPAAKAK